MSELEPSVFIVDDDEAVRDSLQLLMLSAGLSAESFASAQAFLQQFDAQRPGCLILDIRMPGMSGLELQDRLNEVGCILPVIIITGHGDVPMAIRAFKSGIFDFIEKPFNDQVLLDCVQRAIEQDRENRTQLMHHADRDALLETLTAREREVLEHVVSGKANKVIAADLGVSQRTVEVHRAKVMEKLKVRSLADLVRLVLE